MMSSSWGTGVVASHEPLISVKLSSEPLAARARYSGSSWALPKLPLPLAVQALRPPQDCSFGPLQGFCPLLRGQLGAQLRALPERWAWEPESWVLISSLPSPGNEEAKRCPAGLTDFLHLLVLPCHLTLLLTSVPRTGEGRGGWLWESDV